MKIILLAVYLFFNSIIVFGAQEGSYDVVIVGGGIGGLATLDQLVKNGVKNVLVLEGADRVGGRMWTQSDSTGESSYYERGAELVNTSDVELIKLIKDLGLDLVERRFKKEARNEILMFRDRKFGQGGEVIEGDLRPFTFEELLDKMNNLTQDRMIMERILNLQIRRSSQDKDVRAEAIKEIRSMTSRSLVEGGIYTTALFESLMRSEFGVVLNQVNAEVLLDYVRIAVENISGELKFLIELIPNADEKFRIKNGTDSVIKALEARHTQFIHKNSEVVSVIEQTNGSFEIATKGSIDRINTKHVVFAIPSYELPKINIVLSEVSPRRINQAAALPFGSNAKIFLQFKNRFWDKNFVPNTHKFGGVGILESGVQFWDTTENQKHTKEGVITLYPGDWPFDEVAQKNRLKEIIEDLKKVPGLEKLELYLQKVDIQHWPKSYAGIFNNYFDKSPSLFAEKLKTNVYFVGADKDNNVRGQISESYGYMNGAVRTANRASSRIIKKINRDHGMQNNGIIFIKPTEPIKLKCSAIFLGAS